MSRIVVFLDFDGVLCDSVKEAYILARYAYFDIDVYKPIETDKYRLFQKYRYLVSNSWQYFYIMQIIEETPYLDIDGAEIMFKTLVTNDSQKLNDDFNKKFLSKRKELMETDFEFWNALETPTLFLTQLKPIFKNTEKCTFAILSTKNKESIIKKFNYWGINFNPKFIFEKQDLVNITKGQFIKSFLLSHSEYDNAILFDDNEENINSCAKIENLQAILTSWGYLKTPDSKFNEETVLNIIKEKL